MTDRRYFLQRAIICQLEADRRRYDEQNASIRRSTAKIDEQIENFEEKLRHLQQLNALIELPLENYFQQRMERLRISAERHMAAFDAELQHEIEHWKNIHSVLQQPWIEAGLLRSDYGALPRTVQRRPADGIEPIEEENEIQRPRRSLAVLSNGEHRRKRSKSKKTFPKIPSQRNDENDVVRTNKSSASIICLD